MYRTVTYHIDDEDALKAQREDDKLWVAVLHGDEAVEISVDPKHFAALRAAMDDAERFAKTIVVFND